MEVFRAMKQYIGNYAIALNKDVKYGRYKSAFQKNLSISTDSV